MQTIEEARGRCRQVFLKVFSLFCMGVAIALGFAVAGCSKEDGIEDEGHKGVQLWKNGPYWAETNIGAEKPWNFGFYFWWGDTIGYKRVNGAWVASDGSSSSFSFERENAPTDKKDESTLRKEGWLTERGVLAPEHDAAHVHWGGKWRMPTAQEIYDLCDKCDGEYKTLNGVRGYVFRGRGDYASASIFLPFAGCGDGTSLIDVGEGAHDNNMYLSSALRLVELPLHSKEGYYYLAGGLRFTFTRAIFSGSCFWEGHPVRPVQEFRPVLRSFRRYANARAKDVAKKSKATNTEAEDVVKKPEAKSVVK